MPDTWRHRSAQALLGRALSAQGRHAQAEPLLVEAGTKMSPPASGEEGLRLALEALVALCDATGRTSEAASWRDRLTRLASGAGSRPSDW